jgi:hypothetical protein
MRVYDICDMFKKIGIVPPYCTYRKVLIMVTTQKNSKNTDFSNWEVVPVLQNKDRKRYRRSKKSLIIFIPALFYKKLISGQSGAFTQITNIPLTKRS